MRTVEGGKGGVGEGAMRVMSPDPEPGKEGSGDPRVVVDAEGWWVSGLEVLRKSENCQSPGKEVRWEDRSVQERDV